MTGALTVAILKQPRATHARFAGAVTLSGHDGDDAKIYQEKQVKRAIEETNK